MTLAVSVFDFICIWKEIISMYYHISFTDAYVRMLYYNKVDVSEVTDSCRDRWNVRKRLNLIKTQHSVAKSVDAVLILALVLVLIVWSCFEQKAFQMSRLEKVHKSVVFIMKKKLYGLPLMPNFFVVNRKNVCLICFMCRQSIQNFCLKPLKWLLTLQWLTLNFPFSNYKLVVDVAKCSWYIWMFQLRLKK